jgi:hypothetical protein
MKRNLWLILLLASLSGFAQNTINNYKYVLVPEKFDFLKEVNMYNINGLTKFFLEKKGFTVYFDNNQVPQELAGNKCNALIAEVTQRKAVFTTNLTLVLKDCQGNVVFKGKEGKSREKEWAPAYSEALEEAFKSLNEVPYAYTGPATAPAQPTQPKVEATPVSPAPQQTTPVTPAATPGTAAVKEAAGTLYAQATANGFQLIDTTPKIVLTLLKTSAADYFIAAKGDTHGIVLKKGGEWFFEYYSNDKLTAEKLLIKF